MSERFSRRAFSVGLASFLGLGSIASGSEDPVRMCEAIHQDVVLNGSRKRIYEALTDARKFTTVTSFSTVKNAPPAQISGEVGGGFSLFGGHIVGRVLGLVTDRRIVQAWRVVDWDPGIYSIARFELEDQGSMSRVVLESHGLPELRGAASRGRLERQLLGAAQRVPLVDTGSREGSTLTARCPALEE